MENRVGKKLAILLAIFLLVLLMHGAGIQLQFAIDTYWTHWMGFETASADMLLRNGRPVIALLYWILSLLDISIEMFYNISVAMAIFFLVFSVYLYQSIFSTIIKNDWMRVLASFISISNIFIIEYFMFIEKGGFMFAVFFNVLAVWCIWKYIEYRKIRYVVAAFICMLCATMTYQGTIALFVILSLPVIFHYSSGIKEYIRLFLLICLVYWIPVIIDILLWSLFFDFKRPRSTNYIGNISSAIGNMYDAYNRTYNILSTGIYFIFFAIIIVLSLIVIMRTNELFVFNIVNIVFIVLVSSMVPMASLVAGVGWGCPRILYPLTSGFGVLIINYMANIGEENVKCYKHGEMLCVILLIIMTVLEYNSFLNIYIDKYKLNFADEIRCYQIGQAIKEYEAKSGNKITKVAFYYDLNIQDPYYKDVFNDGDLVMTGFIPWDSQLNMLNYYLGTDYERAQENVWYTNYYRNYDWDCYSQEQINFDYDTLSYCVY